MNKSTPLTEQDSLYEALETLSTQELLEGINTEDKKVAIAVENELEAIRILVDAIWPKMVDGGRLFYLGAGTSGRLGIVDASECPPTFGVPHDWVVGIMAGGDRAMRKAVEFAEDDALLGWKDLQSHDIGPLDTVVGLAASGTTPYVIGALEACRNEGIATGCITCNPGSPITQACDFPIAVATGPEFVTGSTRMKAGSAQKMVLNMLSTAVMVKMGRVRGNKMVDMQLSNHKLIGRGTRMVMDATALDETSAKKLLLENGSVRKAVEAYKKK